MARTRTVVHPAPQEQQVPTESSRPTRHFLRNLIVGILITGGVVILLVAALVGVGIFSSKSAPAVQLGQQTQIGPAVENPPAQTGPEVVTPVAPVVVDYQVVWTEVQGFDPSTIPVEEGLYSGLKTYTNPDPETLAYAWKILPHLEKEGNRFITVGAARDQNARNIVLVGITADNNFPYILLSVDGEKSWCTLNLLPTNLWEGRPTGLASEVRVKLLGDEVYLYARHPLGAGPDYLYWWTATVKKSELPCS